MTETRRRWKSSGSRRAGEWEDDEASMDAGVVEDGQREVRNDVENKQKSEEKIQDEAEQIKEVETENHCGKDKKVEDGDKKYEETTRRQSGKRRDGVG